MSSIRERLSRTSPREGDLRALLVLAHEILRQEAALGEASRAVESWATAEPAQLSGAIYDYGQLVRHIHAVAASRLPGDANVLVVSRGDESLFVPGFDMSHFPQGPDGIYAGHYPADSDAAIAHLEHCRAAGAQFLLLPATGLWWLEYYSGLLGHLMSRGRVFHHDDHCLIFDLRVSPGGGPEQ